MIELKEPKYNVGDKVVNQGNVYEILSLAEYSFIHSDYVYLLNDGNYDSEFERYLELYKGEWKWILETQNLKKATKY